MPVPAICPQVLVPNWDPEVCFRIWEKTGARVFNADLKDLIAHLGAGSRSQKVIAMWADYCGLVDKREHASTETNDVANLIRYGLPSDDCFLAITYSLVHGKEYKGKSATKGLSLAAMRQGMHTEDVIRSILTELQEELSGSDAEARYVIERRDHPEVGVRAYPSKGEPPSPMIFLCFVVREAWAVGRECMLEAFSGLSPEEQSAWEALPPAARRAVEAGFVVSAQKRQRLRSLDDGQASEAGHPAVSTRDVSDIFVRSLFEMNVEIQVQIASDYANWSAAFADAASFSVARSLDQATWVQFLRELPDPSRIRARGVLTFEYKNVDNTRHGVAGTVEREYWFEQLEPVDPAHRFVILHVHFKGTARDYVKAHLADVSDARNPAVATVTSISVFHSSNTRRFIRGVENKAFHKERLCSDAVSRHFAVSKEADRFRVFSGGFPGRGGSRANDQTWNAERDRFALRHQQPTQLQGDAQALIWATDPSMHPVNLNESLSIPIIKPERTRSLDGSISFEAVLEAALANLKHGENWSSLDNDERLQLSAAERLLSIMGMTETIPMVGPHVDTLVAQLSEMTIGPTSALGDACDGSCEFVAQQITAILPGDDRYAKYADSLCNNAIDVAALQEAATDADLNELLEGLAVDSGVHQDEDSAKSELQVEDSPLSKIRSRLRALTLPTPAGIHLETGGSSSIRGLNEEVRDEVKYAVTGPQKIEQDATAFVLQVWAMVESKLAMFERELELLRQQGGKQHASEFDELSSAISELIIEVHVTGCSVTPRLRQLTWSRGIRSSNHSVHVPPDFPPDAHFSCHVLIDVPNALKESFQTSFTISRGGSSMEVASLLAANDLRIRYLEARVRHLESWTNVPPELCKAGIECEAIERFAYVHA